MLLVIVNVIYFVSCATIQNNLDDYEYSAYIITNEVKNSLKTELDIIFKPNIIIVKYGSGQREVIETVLAKEIKYKLNISVHNNKINYSRILNDYKILFPEIYTDNVIVRVLSISTNKNEIKGTSEQQFVHQIENTYKKVLKNSGDELISENIYSYYSKNNLTQDSFIKLLLNNIN